MEQEKAKQRQFWLGIGVSLLCLVGIFFLIDPSEIWTALKTADYRFVLLSASGIVGFLLVRGGRWRFMLNNDIPYARVFHIQNIGYMLSMLLPFRLGDVARAVLIGNVPPVTISRGLSTMVVERLLDMLFFVTLLPFTLAAVDTLPDWMQSFARLSGFIAIAAIVVLIIAANQRARVGRFVTAVFNRIPFLDTIAWTRRVDDLLAGLNTLTRPRDGLTLILLSILVWLPILLAYYAGLRAVGLHPTAAMTGFTVAAAAFSVAAPSSPGQVGVFHAGVIAALQLLGQPEVAAASFAFGYHALNMLTMIGLGLIGLAATGEAMGNVIRSTQKFMRKKEGNESHKE